MPNRRKYIENGIIYDGHIPFAKQADSGKIPVVNASGEWELGNVPSGGGFLVTVTENEGVYTADKTFDEITAALDGGITPVLKAIYATGDIVYFPLSSLGPAGVTFQDLTIDLGKILFYGFQIEADGTIFEISATYPSQGN